MKNIYIFFYCNATFSKQKTTTNNIWVFTFTIITGKLYYKCNFIKVKNSYNAKHNWIVWCFNDYHSCNFDKISYMSASKSQHWSDSANEGTEPSTGLKHSHTAGFMESTTENLTTKHFSCIFFITCTCTNGFNANTLYQHYQRQ